jgi:pimeloyl-ACP methyl ester carboxylesterase
MAAAPRRTSRRKAVAIVLLLLLLAVAGHIWFRPLSVMRAAGKFALWCGGIHGHYAQVGPYRVHYYEGGEGRPLVFVHGLGAESLNWTAAMLGYRNQFHVYAIDMLGHGDTEQPDIAYSISQQSEMLHQFLVDQKAMPADVVGVSMGGWITLKLAIDHPEAVNKLVVADAAGLKFDTPITVKNFLPSDHEEFMQFMAMLTPRVHDLPYPLRRDFLGHIADRAWITRRIFASFLTYQDVLDGKLQRINAPTLIVWGAKENMIPLAVGEEMHQQIPNSSLLVCNDSGHLAIYECWNHLKPGVTEFLTAPRSPAASVQEVAIGIR